MANNKPDGFRKLVIGGVVLFSSVFILLAVFLLGGSKDEKKATIPQNISSSLKAVVYKTATCGCCGVFAKYLPKEGIETEVKDISSDELEAMRVDLAIPDDLRSCHITKIGDYFVSGHIPVEAILKLTTEKPQIAGIALAGMPSGTPGMPGPKRESWDIKAIGADKSVSDFMNL